MAKIGLTNFRYALLSDETTLTYDGAKKPGKAVSCSVSVENNSAKLYADDVLAESDYSFKSGTVSMEIDEDDMETTAILLGHEYDKNRMIRKESDAAPYVGLGRVITKVIDGVRKYKLEILLKVKFAEPSQEDATKGESVEFKTAKLEGEISAVSGGENDGAWSLSALYDTKEKAIEELEGVFGKATA